ncbi:protein phosphatase 1 regulatory subunit 15A [Suncus etruscus]|uniref:protein phosphatase 1 regulatory subunit 15A n=1 Tax=Suncus etruscus TaxID=109475 RepID=UPI0021109CF0|nr:protein phosphatase 1 regulatory subunit 15A [Suncus etruscus]
MTPNPEPVQPMAPGQVLRWPSPWKEAHLPCFLLTPLMDLPSWTWSHRRGLRPLQSWPMESLRGTATTTTVKASPLANRAPWGRRSVGDTTAAIIVVKNGAVSGTPGRDLRANSPRPEAQGLCGDGESHGRSASRLPTVLLGPDQRLHAPHDPAEEKGFEEGAVAMEKEAGTFSPPHLERWPPAAVAKGDRETVKKGRSWPMCWQLHPAPNTATSGNQASKKAWVGRLGEDRDREEKEGKEKESRATEKGGGLGPFSIPPTAFLRPWVSRPEANMEGFGNKGAVKEDKAEDPFSIPPTPFLKPWVFWPGEDKEEEENGDLGAAEGAPLVPATHSGASRNVCTFFRGEDTDSEEEDWEEEEEEDSDAGDSEGPSSLSVPLNTHVACLRKDWGEEDDEEVEFEKDNSDLAVTEGHASLSSDFLRNWMYQPREEEEEEEEFLEAADSRPEASPRAWSPATDLPEEPCNFQVAFYLPGEAPPPPWAPPQPPLRLWLRLQFKPPAPSPPEPTIPQKGRKVRFSEKVTVHLLAVWAGPARAARRGPWEQMARDRSRFARRIAQAQKDLGPYLTAVARARARARLRKLAAAAAVAQPSPLGTTTSCSFQAMPLSPAAASSCPLPAGSPSLLVTGRRG